MITVTDFRTKFDLLWSMATPEMRQQAAPYIASVCGIVNSNGQAMLPASTQLPGGPQHEPHDHPAGGMCPAGSCPAWVAKANKHACGGGCGGACNDCKVMGQACQFPNQPGTTPLLIPLGEYPECFDCDCIDKCLYPLLLEARKDFDDYSWIELQKSESPIVHLNKSVGLPADFESSPPLAANESILWSQEDAQQLPWIPGLIKIAGSFTTNPGPTAKILIQFYAGPKGLTNIPDVVGSSPPGLISIARAFPLEDFTCQGDCYLLEWPRVNGCKMRGFPHLRALYVKVTATDIGTNELENLSITVIKQGTREIKRCCKKYGFELLG